MSSNIIGPFPKKYVSPSEKVEKASGDLDDIEEPVITIRKKYLDNERKNFKKYYFQEQSTRTMGWFDLHH